MLDVKKFYAGKAGCRLQALRLICHFAKGADIQRMSDLKVKGNDEVFVVMDMFGGGHNMDNAEMSLEDMIAQEDDDMHDAGARGSNDPAPHQLQPTVEGAGKPGSSQVPAPEAAGGAQVGVPESLANAIGHLQSVAHNPREVLLRNGLLVIYRFLNGPEQSMIQI